MSFDALDLCGPTPPTSPDRPLVKKLIRKLGRQRMEYIDIIPSGGCIEGQCFYNVSELVRLYGGTLIPGWCIWEHPKLYARAEHHAIWQRPDGLCVDPTPKDETFSKIHFIFDYSSPWDGPGHKGKRSIWEPNHERKDACELVRLEIRREELLEKKALLQGNTDPVIDSDLNEIHGQLAAMDRLLFDKGILKLRRLG